LEHTNQKDVTPEELEKRLDEIFGGGEDETESSSDQSVLSNLDSVMLTLDWEISDETMSSFLSEVTSLKSVLSQDRVLGGFLKILHSLGKYIQRRKGQTHPDAFTLLQSVHADLKKAVESQELSSKQKKDLLVKDIEQYNALKSKIAGKRDFKHHEPERTSHGNALQDRQQATAPLGAEEHGDAPGDLSAPPSQEADQEIEKQPKVAEEMHTLADKSVPEAVEELKAVIREEFQKLRKDLGVQ
jgi:hypothetical protein